MGSVTLMLSGYAAENVNSQIVAGLRRHGMDVTTAQERNQRRTDDEILLNSATAEGRLMLTNDTDFLRIHSDWMAAGKCHAGIVFWPQTRPVGEVIRKVHEYATQTSLAAAANMVKYV